MRSSVLKFLISSLIASYTGRLPAEDIRHSFFVAGPTFTGIIDEAGHEVWNSGKPAARDGWVLPNGNVLIAWSDQVQEFTREKEVVFRYSKAPEIGKSVRSND